MSNAAAKAILNVYSPEVPIVNSVPSHQSEADYNEIKLLHDELLPYYLEYIAGSNKLSSSSVQEVLQKKDKFIKLKNLKDKYIKNYGALGVYTYGAKPLTNLKRSRKSRKSRKSRRNRKSRSN